MTKRPSFSTSTATERDRADIAAMFDGLDPMGVMALVEHQLRIGRYVWHPTLVVFCAAPGTSRGAALAAGIHLIENRPEIQTALAMTMGSVPNPDDDDSLLESHDYAIARQATDRTMLELARELAS